MNHILLAANGVCGLRSATRSRACCLCLSLSTLRYFSEGSCGRMRGEAAMPQTALAFSSPLVSPLVSPSSSIFTEPMSYAPPCSVISTFFSLAPSVSSPSDETRCLVPVGGGKLRKTQVSEYKHGRAFQRQSPTKLVLDTTA